NLRTAQARHDRTKNPDGSRTKDDHAIAGPNSRVLDYGIVGHTAGFGKACHFKGEAVRNMMQTTRGHTHIPGHGAVDAISEPLTRWVKVIEATPRHRVIRVNHGSRLADNTVALFPAFHSGAGHGNYTTEFMTKYYRIVHMPTVIGGPLVKVAPANTHIRYLKQHLPFADGRHINLPNFNRAFCCGVVYDRCHFSISHS